MSQEDRDLEIVKLCEPKERTGGKQHAAERATDSLFGRMLREKDECVGDVDLKEISERRLFLERMGPWLEARAIIRAFEQDANSKEAWARWEAVRAEFKRFHDDHRALRAT